MQFSTGSIHCCCQTFQISNFHDQLSRHSIYFLLVDNSLRISNHPAFFGFSNFAVLYKLVLDELGDFFMLCRNILHFLHGWYSTLKHDQSSAILAKQLRFNHSGLTFNAHDKSAVKMMAIVVGLFLTCYGIYLRCDFVLLFFHEASCNDVRYKIPIFVSNSAVNPFTYAFFKRDIKKEIKKPVCRTTFKKDNRPG